MVVYFGRPGNFTLNGTSRSDVVDYSNLRAPITLLPRGVISKGRAGRDRLNRIEVIIGSRSRANTIDSSSVPATTSTSINVNLQQQRLIINNIPRVGSLLRNVLNFTRVKGTQNSDRILGSNFNNILRGNGGNDFIQGFGGNDTLIGGTGNDKIFGGTGNDRLIGDNGNDRMIGGAGNDTLIGGNGNDILVGGRGKDILIDGSGKDIFRFDSVRDSGIGRRRDIVDNLSSGFDKISLANIDANLNISGNQSFRFIGTRSFSGTAGEVRYFTSGGSTILQIDRQGDGDVRAEMEIELRGVSSVRSTDFIL